MWIQIKDFPEYYISNNGKVKSIKKSYNKRKKTTITIEKELSIFSIQGYASVNLVSKNKRKSARVHRLVAEHFIENKEEKPCVNHIDGNKMNANVLNLEWCTYSENELHSYHVLGKKSNGSSRRILTNEQKDKILIKIKNGIKNIEIAREYNVNPSIISNIKRGKTYGS